MRLKVGIFLLLFIIAQVIATPMQETNVLSESPTWSKDSFNCFVSCPNSKKLYTLDTTLISQNERELLKKASGNLCTEHEASKCSCFNVMNYVDVYTTSPAIEERIKFLKSKEFCPENTFSAGKTKALSAEPKEVTLAAEPKETKVLAALSSYAKNNK
jgi:hypothetical protein